MTTEYHVVGPRQIVEQIVITELQFRSIQSGEPLSQYDIVYQDGQLIKKAKADTRDTMDAVGAMSAAVASGVTGNVIIRGRVEKSAWSWTSGAYLFVSPITAGEMTETPPTTSGHVSQQVARALTPTLIEVNPQGAYMIGR